MIIYLKHLIVIRTFIDWLFIDLLFGGRVEQFLTVYYSGAEILIFY